MSARPVNQLLGRISPAESERGLDDGLGSGPAGHGETQKGDESGNTDETHGGSFRNVKRFRKTRCRRAFALVEVTVAMSILTVIGLVLLKLSLNVLHPRQWALHQSVSDAYLTYERAYAQRVPFEVLAPSTGSTVVSPWPVYPQTSTVTVELGRLPGNVPIRGTVIRSRTADPLNLAMDGGSGTVLTNPAAMKTWRLQSVLSYTIGGREYLKSRTVVRTQ